MTSDKKAPDWERIEAEYRANIMSVRQIAQEFGVSDTAIRKRSKKEDWTRDLRQAIDNKADDLVRTAVVRTAVRTHTPTEKETVEANAHLLASVRLSHRKDIERARLMTMSLFDELDAMIGRDAMALLQDLGELMYKPNEKGQDKLNDAYMKIIQMPSRVSSLKMLTDSLKTVVGLEREAYGLNKEAEQVEDAFTSMLNRIAQANSSTFQPIADDPEYEN